MKTKALIIVLIAAALNGCSIFENFRQKPPPVDLNTRVVIDPRILAGCDQIPEITGDIDLDKLVDHYVGLIKLYGICSAKQRISIQTIRELANLPVDKSKE